MANTKAATAATSTDMVITDLRIAHVEITVKGVSPLICHRFSEKARKQILDKQTGKATAGREKKNPQEQFELSLYPMPDGDGYGFPSVAFKSAAVRAGTYVNEKMTFLRGAFHVDGELVKIEGTPEMREDMVRLKGTTADVRFRGEFKDWSATIPVRINVAAISVEQVLNLFRIAGFAVGIGEWRPEKNGQYGLFEPTTVEVKGTIR